MSLAKFYSRPGHLIRRLNQISQALFYEETAGVDLTPVQYAALNMVQEVPGIEQASLSDMIAFDRPTIVKVLRRLVDKKLIKRVRSATDRRVNHLDITARGSQLLTQIRPMLNRIDKRILAPLPEGDRERFMEMLAQLVQANNVYSRAPLDTSLQRDMLARRRSARAMRTRRFG
jgi:MarR family transcriptional regulator, temperature-dependent positive regulator of motility